MQRDADLVGSGPGGGGVSRPFPRIILSGPGSMSVANGERAALTLDVERVLTSATVDLAVEGLPDGVSGQIVPSTLPIGLTPRVTLVLTATPTALATVTSCGISATAAGAEHAIHTVQLTVTSPYSEIPGAPTLSIETTGQSSLTIPAPVPVTLPDLEPARVAVNLELAAGVQGPVEVTIPDLPAGVLASVEPQSVDAPGEAGPVGVTLSFILVSGASPVTALTTARVSVGGEVRGVVEFTLETVPLYSNINYFLFSSQNGQLLNLTGASVTIEITEDLVSAPPGPGEKSGFVFQFNTLSPPNDSDPNWIVWQQYGIGAGRGPVGGFVNNWTAASLSSVQTINSQVLDLFELSELNTLPAGTTLTISLLTDASDNVNGVTFESPGYPPQTLMLTSLQTAARAPVTTADLAPIVAITLNLVGPGDRYTAHFVSGSGTITYRADTPLTPGFRSPPGAVFTMTGETANSVYGALPPGPAVTFTQEFAVNPSQL